MKLKTMDKILLITLSMLTIFMFIDQLWNPSYFGGLLTGCLFGYTMSFWFYSSIVHGYRDLTNRGMALLKKTHKRNEILEARIYFMSKPIETKPKAKPKKRK